VGDPRSVFSHYRALIELRHREPVVAHGDVTLLLPHDERGYAFTSRLQHVELPEPVAGFVLRCWEARVYRRPAPSQPTSSPAPKAHLVRARGPRNGHVTSG
jgi:glycosidase